MEQAVAIAAEYDVVMAFEPEVANVVDSARKGRLLLDAMRSPHLEGLHGWRQHFPCGRVGSYARHT